MARIRSIRTGRRDASTTTPSHMPGVTQGQKGSFKLAPGLRADGTSTARRSTGVNPDFEEPIDPRMPNLSPA